MNILYVTYKDPRVINGGNELRTHLLWKALQEKGKVYTLVFNFAQQDRVVYNDSDKTICFYNPNKLGHFINNFAYRIISEITGIPFLPFVKYREFEINDLFKEINFDLIVGRYINSLQFYHLWKYAPTYIDIDDHPIQVFDTLVRHKLPYILRPLGRFLNRYQLKYILNRINGGWIANEEQLSWCSKNINYLPNIPLIPSEPYNYKSQRDGYLFTIGVMSYPPNYLGVDKFLREIWPIFHAKYPDIKYYIGGKGAPKVYYTKWNEIEGVKYIGYIEDLSSVYEKCNAVVVPIYAGGGTCIKTLEALAYSRVCLSTPFGSRGLPIDESKEKRGLLIFNNSAEFIVNFEKIQNIEEREEMEVNGYEFINEQYNIESFKKAVTKVID